MPFQHGVSCTPVPFFYTSTKELGFPAAILSPFSNCSSKIPIARWTYQHMIHSHSSPPPAPFPALEILQLVPPVSPHLSELLQETLQQYDLKMTVGEIAPQFGQYTLQYYVHTPAISSFHTSRQGSSVCTTSHTTSINLVSSWTGFRRATRTLFTNIHSCALCKASFFIQRSNCSLIRPNNKVKLFHKSKEWLHSQGIEFWRPSFSYSIILSRQQSCECGFPHSISFLPIKLFRLQIFIKSYFFTFSSLIYSGKLLLHEHNTGCCKIILQTLMKCL